MVPVLHFLSIRKTKKITFVETQLLIKRLPAKIYLRLTVKNKRVRAGFVTRK